MLSPAGLRPAALSLSGAGSPHPAPPHPRLPFTPPHPGPLVSAAASGRRFSKDCRGLSGPEPGDADFAASLWFYLERASRALPRWQDELLHPARCRMSTPLTMTEVSPNVPMSSFSKSQFDRTWAKCMFSFGNVICGSSQKPARHRLFLLTVSAADMFSPSSG